MFVSPVAHGDDFKDVNKRLVDMSANQDHFLFRDDRNTVKNKLAIDI